MTDIDAVIDVSADIEQWRPSATRVELPRTRVGRIRKFNLQSFKGYIVVNCLNGYPVEVFIHVGKEGGALHGLLIVVAKLVSLSLKHGVPASDVAASLRGEAFEPSGFGHLGDGKTRQFDSIASLIADALDGSGAGGSAGDIADGG